jgi:hypothetical protein
MCHLSCYADCLETWLHFDRESIVSLDERLRETTVIINFISATANRDLFSALLLFISEKEKKCSHIYILTNTVIIINPGHFRRANLTFGKV